MCYVFGGRERAFNFFCAFFQREIFGGVQFESLRVHGISFPSTALGAIGTKFVSMLIGSARVGAVGPIGGLYQPNDDIAVRSFPTSQSSVVVAAVVAPKWTQEPACREFCCFY